MKLTLTKLQCQELAHKMCILRDEPELQESYEITQEEANDLAGMFLSNEKEFELDSKFADVLIGEIENLLDIADSNMGVCASTQEDMEMRSYISSMKRLISKIRKASN